MCRKITTEEEYKQLGEELEQILNSKEGDTGCDRLLDVSLAMAEYENSVLECV